MEKNPSIKESTLRNDAADDQEFMSEPVPMDKRHSTKDQVMVWIGFGYVVTGLVVGGQIGGQGGAGLPPLAAFLSVALGMGFLFLLTSFIGIASQKTGYNLSLLCRFSYGERGSTLPLAMMAIMTLGWFASIAGMIGQIWGAWIGNPSGVIVFDPSAHGFHGIAKITLEEFLSTFIWGLIFTYTAVRGMGAMEKVANIFAPFIMIVAIVMGFVYISQAGGVSPFLTKAGMLSGMSMGTAITAVVGSWIVGAIMGADLFRFNKNISAVWWCSAACFIFTNPILNVVGYIGAVQTGDFNYVMYMLGVSIPVAILGIIVWTSALWTTDNGELYCNALYTGPVLRSYGFNVERKQVVIVVGVLGSILGSLAFYQLFFADFINVLGIMGPPIASPILADYFISGRHRKYNPAALTYQPTVRWAGIISFAIGAAIALYCSYGVTLPGEFPSGVFAMIVSFVVYIVIYRLLPDAAADQRILKQING
ncbi:cytosine permease [uncultured Selenomonas sp.]|jgi:NCS1 family nucleobase:cation symporter-1|uniref:purine-cytosine permease family protein n=1 Tax=uncultured Selenomonas sp. TaxID=159275 RepID=UPI0028DC0B0C|nr:cytosine permease [uncultured Selenomonas sp.]